MLARAGWRHLLRHPWQLALALLGISLGVASVLGISLANQSAKTAFGLSVRAVSGNATHQVYGPPEGIPEQLYPELRLRGVTAAPVVDGFVRLDAGEALTGDSLPIRGRTFRLLGLDVTAEAPFRAYTGANAPIPTARLFTHPGAVLMARQTADELGLQPGQEFRVRMGTRGQTLLLLATLSPDSELSRRALEGVLIADIATAQEVLGLEGRLTRIDLILDGAEPDLPPGCRLVPAGERERTLGAMSEAFHLNLTALSLLSLIVGMFLIYQTSSFTVVQRRSLWGRLRTLGVTRGEILRIVLTEALWLGSLGTLLGLLLGYELSQVLLKLVSRTLNDLYFVVQVTRVQPTPGPFLVAGALGVATTLLAALAPAWEATTSPAGCVLARSDAEERARRLVWPVARGGFLAAILGLLTLVIPSRNIVLGLAGMFLLMVGLAVMSPWAAVALSRLARPRGLLARLAVRSLGNSLSRTGVALAALTLAVSATVGIGVMVDSFRSTLVGWLGVTLQEDVYLAPPTVISGRNTSTLDEPFVELVKSTPGVATVSLYRAVEGTSPEGPVRLVALDPSEPTRNSFQFQASTRDVWSDFARGGVLISEPFAYRLGLTLGSELPLLTDSGMQSFPVAGVFTDYGTPEGVVILARPVYLERWQDRRITSLAVTARAGQDVDLLVRSLQERAGDREVLIRSNRALREASLRIFEQTFTVTGVLRLLAVLVAFAGLASSLIALGLERARELAVLRALGLTRGQVFRLLALQSLWLGLVAGVLALPLGLAQALGMIFVINKRSFGWTLELHLEPAILLQAVALSVLAALLACLVPASRQARLEVAAALHEE